MAMDPQPRRDHHMYQETGAPVAAKPVVDIMPLNKMQHANYLWRQ